MPVPVSLYVYVYFLLFIATYHQWPIPSTGQSHCIPPFHSGNYIFPYSRCCVLLSETTC